MCKEGTGENICTHFNQWHIKTISICLCPRIQYIRSACDVDPSAEIRIQAPDVALLS